MKVYPLDNHLHNLKNQLISKNMDLEVIRKEISLLHKIINETEAAHEEFKKANKVEEDTPCKP